MTDWGAGAITRELGGAGKGFDAALATLADAADFAQWAAEHVAGFPGMARGIRAIKQALETNHERVQALAVQLVPLSAMVETITADSTPGQVTAALDPVPDELGDQVVDTMRTKAALGEAGTLIRCNLEGGEPQHLLYRVGKARWVMEAIRGRLDKAKAATEVVLANARQAGTAEQAGLGGGGGQEPPGELLPVPAGAPEEPEPVGPDAGMPSFVQRIADTFRHARPPSTQTVGYLVDRHGRPLHDERLISGSDGPARGAPGLNPDYPASGWESALTHVEGHAAALLRRPEAPTDAVLVVSKEPCPPPRGCRVVLPPILPEGTTLHVYLAEPGKQPRWYDSYPGNGRGLAR